MVDKVGEAIQTLLDLPDDFFDKRILVAMENAVEANERLMKRSGYGWKVTCRERFRAMLIAVKECGDFI